MGAVSVPLAGCSGLLGGFSSRQVSADWAPSPGEWGGPGYDQANSGHNPHASPPLTEPTIAWDVASSLPSVVIAEETVFLRESGSLRALAAADGSESYEVSRPESQLVAWSYVAGRFYEGTANGLDAVALDGESVWDDPTRYVDRVSGFVERDGYVYATTGIESLHHHDAETGERVDATVHDAVVQGLANHEGVLYAVLADGVAAYDTADDGSLDERWRHRIEEESEFEPIHFAVGGGQAALVLHDRTADETRVSVFGTGGSEFLHALEFDQRVTRIVIGEYSYVATIRTTDSRPTGGEIRAYDGTEERWTVELETPPFSLVLADKTLIVGGSNEQTLAIGSRSGDNLWAYEGTTPLAVVGETIYGTTAGDRFVALRE